jgi:hypothetical protein
LAHSKQVRKEYYINNIKNNEYWQKKNRDYSRAYRNRNPEKIKEYNREKWQKHGVSLADKYLAKDIQKDDNPVTTTAITNKKREILSKRIQTLINLIGNYE